MNDRIYQPGLQKIEEADYHAIRYCSKHALDVLFDRSPAHLHYQRENPESPSDAMKFGSAFHTRILEPEHFKSLHPIASQCVAVTGKGEPCRNDGKVLCADGWRCGVHGKTSPYPTPPGTITVDQARICERMAEAIAACEPARQILEAQGDNEIAGIWDQTIGTPDGDHVVRCKMKVDCYRPTFDALVDLKTCESAHPSKFARTIADYGYHRQAAYYLDGFNRLTPDSHPLKNFVIVAVEKAAPFGVAVYVLKQDDIELGRAQNAKLIQTYARCEKTRRWPGYENEFQDIGMNAFAFRTATAEV